MGHFLDALQDFQAAASPLALHRVGGIGHELQLAQDELRDQQHAVHEMSLADIGNAAVDDHAGIEHLGHAPRAAFAAEQAPERLQVEHVPFAGAHHQADVGHHQQQRHVQERARAVRNRRARQHQPHQVGAEDPEDRSDRRPDQAAQAGPLQPHLKQENSYRKNQPDAGIQPF